MTIALSNAGKYEQVLDRLRGRLRQGEFAAGDQLPSQRALAREYGVNLSTVNKAVSILASEGRLEQVHGRGMFVTQGQRETGLQAIGMIHEIHPDLVVDHVYYTRLFATLNHLVNQDHHSFQPFLRDTPTDYAPLRQSRNPALRRVLDEGGLSGLIVFVDNPLLLHDELESLGLPYVCLAGNAAHSHMPNCLTIDAIEVGRQAARYLIGTGCRRLGVVQRPNSMLMKGLSEVCKHEPKVVLQIFATLEEALAEADGIFLKDDYFALRHFDQLLAALPPERLIVFANTDMAFPQPLPRIDIDPRRVARCVWKSLQARLRQEPLPTTPVLIPPVPSTPQSRE